MQCPNCRKIEKGQWLYAHGSRALPDFNMDDWAHDEDLYDLSYSEMVNVENVIIITVLFYHCYAPSLSTVLTAIIPLTISVLYGSFFIYFKLIKKENTIWPIKKKKDNTWLQYHLVLLLFCLFD